MEINRTSTISSLAAVRPGAKQDSILPTLLSKVRESYCEVTDHVNRKTKISLPDCIMSGLAMFGLKYQSLLQFDNDSHYDPILSHNLKSLFEVKQVPSDTYFRERLDVLNPHELQESLNTIMKFVEEQDILSRFKYIDGYHLVALDATGTFSSHKVHCQHCCEKHHRDGSITFHHQTLAAVMVHPEQSAVLPMIIEPITKADGDTKNDCEHNAAKRLLVNLRKQYPDLKMIIVMDALYADGPMISLFKELNLRYIITAKESDLPYLFEQYSTAEKEKIVTTSSKDALLTHQYALSLSLNKTHQDIEVNVLECVEKSKIKEIRFCYITDLMLSQYSAPIIVVGGRTRWHIENATFNTLKNQGYNFEHNFGHGTNNLCSVLTWLMFTAFAIDQVIQLCCETFNKVLAKCKSKISTWRKIDAYFTTGYLDSWDQLYSMILSGSEAKRSHILNTE